MAALAPGPLTPLLPAASTRHAAGAYTRMLADTYTHEIKLFFKKRMDLDEIKLFKILPPSSYIYQNRYHSRIILRHIL